MMSTARLVAALRDVGAPAAFVEAAEANRYHDFRSPLAMPITALVAEARRHGLEGIARRAMAGEFDASREEWP